MITIYNVGDKVKIKDEDLHSNKIGTIIEINPQGPISFDYRVRTLIGIEANYDNEELEPLHSHSKCNCDDCCGCLEGRII